MGSRKRSRRRKDWLLGFKERDREGQLQLFSTVLSKYLPEIQGQLFLLDLYASTLDLRVQATTARAFGDSSQAQKLRAEAVSIDEKLDAAIRQYSTGGSVCYVLESDQGLLVTQSQQ